MSGAGMHPERLERLRPMMEKHIGSEALSGVVTLLERHGEIVHEQALGHRDRERDLPMRTDTLFRIFSMTKPITCTALMMLYEAGKFQLSDPVSQYLPKFAELKVLEGNTENSPLVPLERPVTVRDLLTHMSGMTYHFAEYGAVERMYREAALPPDLPLGEFVDALASMPLTFQPGTAWRYSFSQDVVAHLVEVLSDRSFDEFLKTELFDPLGMTDTGFYVEAVNLDRFSAMYGAQDVIDQEATSSALLDAATAGKNTLISDPHQCFESKPHNVSRGGHGLVSTARDYLQFCRMMLNNGAWCDHRFLSRKTVELMRCNHVPAHLMPIGFEDGPTPGQGYGLGFGTVMDVGQSEIVGSAGTFYWSGAATTSFWIDPEESMIGIQMAQFQPSGFHLVAQDFQIGAYQAHQRLDGPTVAQDRTIARWRHCSVFLRPVSPYRWCQPAPPTHATRRPRRIRYKHSTAPSVPPQPVTRLSVSFVFASLQSNQLSLVDSEPPLPVCFSKAVTV